jgi:hypothetical protein
VPNCPKRLVFSTSSRRRSSQRRRRWLISLLLAAATQTTCIIIVSIATTINATDKIGTNANTIVIIKMTDATTTLITKRRTPRKVLREEK